MAVSRTVALALAFACMLAVAHGACRGIDIVDMDGTTRCSEDIDRMAAQVAEAQKMAKDLLRGLITPATAKRLEAATAHSNITIDEVLEIMELADVDTSSLDAVLGALGDSDVTALETVMSVLEEFPDNQVGDSQIEQLQHSG